MEFRKVYNEMSGIQVNPSLGVHSMIGFSEVKAKDHEHERDKEKNRNRKRVKDYFKTVAKATEMSNQLLEARGIPYRFCVYERDDRVLIDFISLDVAGKVKETQTKDVTNEDFSQWIENIVNNAGLNIDKTG